MKRSLMATLMVMIVAVNFACGSAATPSPAPPANQTQAPATVAAPTQVAATAAATQVALLPPAWQQKWDTTLAAAKKEGAASIYAYVGTDTRGAVTKAFKDRYGVDLDFTIAPESELLQKITTERENNQKLVDLTILSPMSYIAYLKPMNVLAPMDDQIILPEVSDPTKWTGGKFPMYDADRTIITPIAAYFSYILINTDLVKQGEITSYQDLLKPAYRGKMVMFDPTAGPSPTQTFVNYVIPKMMGAAAGKEYLQALAKQDVMYIKDHRQLVEWVAKEKYPIAIGTTPAIAVTFTNAGSPIAYVRPKEGGLLAVGSSLIAAMKNAPHPNATKIFLNWMLTDEGQEIFAANQAYPPRRLGTAYKGPDSFPVVRPTDKTFESDEAFYADGQKTVSYAKDIFGPVVGK